MPAAAALGDPALLFEALCAHAAALLFADQLPEAERVARRALAMYRAAPQVARPGAVPGPAHLFNRLHVLCDWRGQLHDAYRFAAEALVAAGPEVGQGVLLADVFGGEVALGVVGRATELYAATGWRTAFHAPGGRWADVSIARLLAAEGNAWEAAEWLIDLADQPETADLPLVTRWQLAGWAGMYGVEFAHWDVVDRALDRLEKLYHAGGPFSRRHLAELSVLRAERAHSAGETRASRAILAELAAADNPYDALVMGRAALLRAADELARGQPEAAFDWLADAAGRFDVLPAQLRPRYDRLRRAALAAIGDHRTLADDLNDEISMLGHPRRRTLAADVLGEDLGGRLGGVFDELQAMLVGQLRWERGEVVEAISHDLAGALAIVRLSLDLLDVDRARVRDALRAATQRMRAIVDAFALLVSIERSRLRPALDRHEFGTLIERVVANMRPLADAKRMPIELDIARARGTEVLADLGFFEMSLSNVLANAIKYAPHGTPITVRAERIDSGPLGPGAMMAASVSDHGPGLAASELDAVFLRHVRGSARPTGAEPSLGLGLYISRAMCELMGGRVWAEPSGPGTGATFVLALPEAELGVLPAAGETPVAAASGSPEAV